MNPILGYCCGAENSKRFDETEKLAVIVANSWTFFCFLMFMFIPRTMLGWMNATPEMYEIGVTSFRLLAMSMCILGASIVMTQVFPPVKVIHITYIGTHEAGAFPATADDPVLKSHWHERYLDRYLHG